MSERTKTCNVCLIEKPVSAFGLNNVLKDKLQRTCKKCRAEQRRIIRAAERLAPEEPPLRERINESRKEGERYRKLAAESHKRSGPAAEALARYYERTDL